MMNWTLLVIAGVFEVLWAVSLKYNEGFTRFWPSVVTLVTMTISVGLLSIAMRNLPVGTAYAVWVGIGAIGTVALGIMLFGEETNIGRLLSVGLIAVGIIGLKVTSS